MDIAMDRLTWSDEIYNIFEFDEKQVYETNFAKTVVKICSSNEQA